MSEDSIGGEWLAGDCYQTPDEEGKTKSRGGAGMSEPLTKEEIAEYMLEVEAAVTGQGHEGMVASASVLRRLFATIEARDAEIDRLNKQLEETIEAYNHHIAVFNP